MTNGSQPLSSIALIGNSHKIWPVAALLSQSLPSHIKLTIIENNDAANTPAALTIPCGNIFHETVGITTADLMIHYNGTLGLGTDMPGWRGEDSDFFAARSGTLPGVEGVALHHIMLRAALMQDQPDQLAYLYQPFRFAARTAAAGKFEFPSTERRFPFQLLRPTAQIDRADYTALLKELSGIPIKHILSARPIGVTISPDTGSITSVRFDNAPDITADLFIDVSGKLSSLFAIENGAAPDKSQRDILPFDRCLSLHDEASPPGEHNHTAARAIRGGLLVETPLRSGTISELLFSSEDFDEQSLTSLTAENTSASRFETYFVEHPWTGNLLRIGGASARLGPYQSADAIVLQEQVLQFVTKIPASTMMHVEAREYNHGQMHVLEEIRDFILLPFFLNRRSDAPWKAAQMAQIPESLELRINQFQSRGRFVAYENEIFNQQSWIEMMIGFGLTPKRFDPMARSVDMIKIRPVLKNLIDDFNQTIRAMPSLSDYMEDHYPAAVLRDEG